MLADGIYALLAGADEITSIVGTPATRDEQSKTSGIFKVQMPEAAAAPAVVFSQVTGDSNISMEGPDAFRLVRYQFDCYGTSPQDAAALARAVRRLLEKTTGELDDGSEVDGMECILESETFEDAPFLFRALLDVKIAFRDFGT